MSTLSSLFPILAEPMGSSRLLGLYFASSWCPDCTPVTPRLKSLYNSQTSIDGKKQLEIVYVSSDSDAVQMEKSMKENHGSWGSIPFDSEERAGLKRHFGVCAAKETGELGMADPGKRKFGIPTLVIIDCDMGNVIATDGVEDVMKKGVEALAGWEEQLPNTVVVT